MNCNCGGNTEGIHRVVRDKTLQGEYQSCPNCGRVKWLWATDSLQSEIGMKETSNYRNKGRL